MPRARELARKIEPYFPRRVAHDAQHLLLGLFLAAGDAGAHGDLLLRGHLFLRPLCGSFGSLFRRNGGLFGFGGSFERRGERFLRFLRLLLHLGGDRLALDVDLPAREARGKAGVLPVAADGEESLSSGTTAIADFSPVCVTETTVAGESALAMNSRGFSLQRMISTFSPPSSCTTALTRAPLLPTHAPTASTRASSEAIAIFVLCPASREMDLMTTVPCFISGTSSSKRRLTSRAPCARRAPAHSCRRFSRA